MMMMMMMMMMIDRRDPLTVLDHLDMVFPYPHLEYHRIVYTNEFHHFAIGNDVPFSLFDAPLINWILNHFWSERLSNTALLI